MGAVMPEPEYNIPLQKKGDIAIYVLARISGEGSDRKPIPGDFLLTKTEIRDILYLNEHFKKFILVLNVGGIVDLSPVLSVKNILLLSQLGMVTGEAFVDVLFGKAYPSRKLTASWGKLKDYEQLDFGNPDDTQYNEEIFVGYRGFDKDGRKALFPFGYGLGYTSFELKRDTFTVNQTFGMLDVTVENTGYAKGKEVVQVYISKPSDKLVQPRKELVAFAKTKEIAPGDNDKIHLGFELREFASFDEKRALYILESGDYKVLVGCDSEHLCEAGCISVKEEIIVRDLNKTVTDFMKFDWSWYSKKVKDFVSGLTDNELAYLCVGGFIEQGSESIVGNAGIKVVGSAVETTPRIMAKGVDTIVMADGPAGLRLAATYGVDEKGKYAIESGFPEQLMEFLDDTSRKMLGANCNEQREGKVFEQNCTAIPIETAIASSFNLELAKIFGDIVDYEMERFEVDLWLALALNIQISPLCGRNFEYFSEDPYVSGKFAAAITLGVQQHPGKGVTMKHFCCNNQETNSYYSNSIVDERTMREIYLRGFEIAIKEAKSMAVMTSYDLLNGEHTSQHENLLWGILRGEWNYRGLIMTDWVTPGFVEHKYPSSCAAGSIKAGNNLTMPGGQWDIDSILNALADEKHPYHINREQLEWVVA